MRPQLAASLLLVVSVACKEEPAPQTGPEPMRAAPVGGEDLIMITPPSADDDGETGEAEASSPAPSTFKPLAERPRADPDIERALDLIGASGLRFVDPPSEPDERPSEYTAEQFASMLRTKWDWIGYDLTELEPWLDAIATRSFKTNLAYEVVLADGTKAPLRSWLDARLHEGAADDR